MSILIVEDNPINDKILEVNLQNKGYQTILAQSAKKALELLTSAPQIQLIIADIMMPEMDGLELLAKIKEQPEWRDIPVIMCSALADIETVKRETHGFFILSFSEIYFRLHKTEIESLQFPLFKATGGTYNGQTGRWKTEPNGGKF
jgi:CheY-like chemotaxis protein